MPAGRGERRHQQFARPLAQRFVVGQCDELGDEAFSHAGVKALLGARFDRPDSQLGEAGRFGPPGVDIGKFGISRAVPPPEDFVDRARGVRVVRVERTVGGIAQPVGIDVESGTGDGVAVRRRVDRALWKAATEAGHVRLQRPGRIPRRPTGPERLDCRIGRDNPTAVEHQQGEQPALQRAFRGDVVSGAVGHPEWPQHLDAQPALATHQHNGTGSRRTESNRIPVDSNASSVEGHADESTTDVAARTDVDGVAARHRAVEVVAAPELARPHGDWRAPWPVPDLWRAPLVGQPVAQGHRRDDQRRAGLCVHRVPARPVERRASPGWAGHHTSHAAGENRRAADGQSGFGRRPTWDDVRSAQARRDAVP